MTDKLYLDIEKAQLATTVLEAVSGKLQKQEKRLYNEWLNSSRADSALREDIWHKMQAIRDLHRAFNADINNGNIAENQLTRRIS